MDIRQAITDRIIAIMDRGAEAWRKSWTTAAATGFPMNGKTRARYNGVNVLLLWDRAQEQGYTSNVWLTFKQAQELGGMVRKGEKGVMCVYFEMMQKKGKGAGAEGEESAEFFPMCKPFWLFNVSQIDGLPADLIPTAPVMAVPEFHAIEEAERVLAASGAEIHHNGGNRAFYRRDADSIHMPERERFATSENYYATALHELTHWTGAPHRLDRVKGKRFGDDAYAFEELVAELGASFVCGQLGLVEATIEQHASYVDSWLRVLKNDKNAIFSAAKLAGQASDYIMAFGAADESAAQAAAQ